ncbi:hypothetical protein HER21_42360, partial [Pseudomonas sp. BGM005]|nr:hypothetical protein [Pseudomonas sp. BG5]
MPFTEPTLEAAAEAFLSNWRGIRQRPFGLGDLAAFIAEATGDDTPVFDAAEEAFLIAYFNKYASPASINAKAWRA